MTAEPRTMSAGEVQLCPKCRIPMSVSDVTATMPTTGLDEGAVVYRCHRCGAGGEADFGAPSVGIAFEHAARKLPKCLHGIFTSLI